MDFDSLQFIHIYILISTNKIHLGPFDTNYIHITFLNKLSIPNNINK